MRGVSGFKWCASCADELPLSAFAADARIAGGYAHVCRVCAGVPDLMRQWSRRAAQLQAITARRLLSIEAVKS